jgi:uncharacterized membrane protein
MLLVLGLTCLLGLTFKTHCMPGGWTGSEQYSTGCYSDAVPFWQGREVDTGKLPYLQARVEYPVLTGAAIWIEGSAVRLLFGRAANASHFLVAVTLVNAALAFLLLAMLRGAGLPSRRLWAWAAAPPLILYLGHNWDMIAVILAVWALLRARENRLVRAAAAAGLGVAAKLFPIVMLPLLGLSALFERGQAPSDRLRRAAMVSAAAVGAWALVNLPVALLAPENWSEFYRFSQERGGTAGATWEVLTALGLFPWPEAKNLVAALAFLAGAAAILACGWQRHRDRLWVLFTPLLAWFLLTNKVYSPQFDLWLYPMLLMTAPRLWPVALYVAAGAAAYFAEFWWFAGMEGAWPAASYGDIACAAIVRGAALVWLIVDCVRRDPPDWIGIRAAAG